MVAVVVVVAVVVMGALHRERRNIRVVLRTLDGLQVDYYKSLNYISSS